MLCVTTIPVNLLRHSLRIDISAQQGRDIRPLGQPRRHRDSPEASWPRHNENAGLLRDQNVLQGRYARGARTYPHETPEHEAQPVLPIPALSPPMRQRQPHPIDAGISQSRGCPPDRAYWPSALLPPAMTRATAECAVRHLNWRHQRLPHQPNIRQILGTLFL